MIPFNKPFIAGKELYYIAQAVTMGNLGGDGHFAKACAGLMEKRFGIHKVRWCHRVRQRSRWPRCCVIWGLVMKSLYACWNDAQ